MAGGSRAGAWMSRLLPYLAIAFLYVATWPYHQGLNNPNEMVRVYMTRALVEHGTPVIDQVISEWGMVDDKALRDGKLYSSKAPLQSLAGVPAYAVLSALDDPPELDKREVTIVLRIFGSAVWGILLASILMAWSRRRAVELGAPRAAGTGLGLVAALGTMHYPYAITFTGHILAALTAGGTYLAVVAMSRAPARSPGWRRAAVLAGLAAGACPFAEYPAALIALPVLLAALWLAKGLRAKLEAIGLLALGGAAPFGLGLWAHWIQWGSPFRTGYTFLENKHYVQVHHDGFFGVTLPKLEPFLGTLFSPGTGLFFFSPVLAVGLVALLVATFRRAESAPSGSFPRPLAIAALAGIAFEMIFISGHEGWRGGWTLGPRYIIGVAPVLFVWVVESLGMRGLRALAAPLGAASILLTGFAAALYPHLSDIYANPLASFVWPSYRRGESTYGLAHSLGLDGTAANLVHVLPLAAALVFAGLAAAAPLRRAATLLAIVLAAAIGGVAMIPEHDRSAALRENERLWGFWEPARRREDTRPRPPGLVYRARDQWRSARVEAELEGEGRKVPCRWQAQRCEYGGMPWQRFGPDFLRFDGEDEPVLFLHPITGWIVRASFYPPASGRRGILRYGLSDESAAATDNTAPVELRLLRGGVEIARASVPPGERGLRALAFDLDEKPAPIAVELRAAKDGARVMGIDLEVYEVTPGPEASRTTSAAPRAESAGP